MGWWVLWAGLLAAGAPGRPVVGVNLTPAQTPALTAALEQVQLAWTPGLAGQDPPPGALLIWQAVDGRGAVTEAGAERLAAHLVAGGSLLLGLSERPGIDSLRLAPLLPTTLWSCLDPRLRTGSLTLAEADGELFQPGEVVGLTAPYAFPIRPWHAIERGQARYDRYDVPAPWVAYRTPDNNLPKVPGGSFWWTRPLLNRDWRIAARADDLAASPLLLTGRYGAGRVAVWASTLTLPDTPPARALFAGTLRWLAATPPPVTDAPARLTAVAADGARRRVVATVSNPADRPTEALLLARLLTWEGAPTGDLQQTVRLGPGATAEVLVPLPAVEPTGYQALADRDAWLVRCGLLTGDGRRLLGERVVRVDARPRVRLSLAPPELRQASDSPPAPASGAPWRMGFPIHQYAVRPGGELAVRVELTADLRNLAPLAEVTDETTPGNGSLVALTDEAVLGEKGPDWYATTAWGDWRGRADVENVLTFTLPAPATLAAVTLVGVPDEYRNQHWANPGGAVIEVDGREVARDEGLAARFAAEAGRVRLSFAPTLGRQVRVRLPWLRETRRRAAPKLGEVELEGTFEPLGPPLTGRLTVRLVDALAGTSEPLGSEPVELAPASRRTMTVTARPPAGVTARCLRLEALFEPAGGPPLTATAPVLVCQPTEPLRPVAEVRPAAAAQVGFIVTRGFRNVFDLGVGTAELGDGWGQPDDLVWAYARGLKQLGPRSDYQAGRLYVTENDMRHYSTPWRTFYNGEEFYDVAAPRLVERLKEHRDWERSDIVVLEHSDRWDSGPEVHALHAWQDFEAFDAWLRARGEPGLTGRTKAEVAAAIHERHEAAWNLWHLERYVAAVRRLREAFAAEGKRLQITAQGSPLVPLAYAAEIGEVVRGTSDDSTWGMIDNDPVLTTGRQMGVLAFNPYLAMSTLNQWGYDSNVLGNRQWRGPVGTTEPSRRHQYDRAFRGVVRPDGRYTSLHTYGYNSNAGYAYTMSVEDLNAWHRVQQKQSLLTPDEPVGAGLVISTTRYESPAQARFDTGSGWTLEVVRQVARTVAGLQGAGVAISFVANAECLPRWAGAAPLIVVNPADLSPGQLAELDKRARAGQPVAALAEGELPAPVTALFAGRGGTMLLAVAPERADQRTWAAAGERLRPFLRQALAFPPGTAGYGFRTDGLTFVVIEDWREEGRRVELGYRPPAGTRELRAADADRHEALFVRRVGDEFRITCDVRPGDGLLVALEERR